MTPIKVLFVIPTLRGGGAERVIVTLLRELDRKHFTPTLAVVDIAGEVYLTDIPDDIEIINLKATRVRYALAKILLLLWKRKPNVLFSTLGHLNIALGLIRWATPSKLLTVVRETSIVSMKLNDLAYGVAWGALYRQAYKRHDLVICQSQYMRHDLVEVYKCPMARTVVIPNPVDIERIRVFAQEPVQNTEFNRNNITKLVAAGRLSPVKGFDLLIHALASLHDAHAHLFLLGEGPDEGRLRHLAEELGIAARVHFIGFQRNPYAWFAKADVFVLSSRHEGFPNVVLEALVCRVPVVATPAPGGTKEILSGSPESVIASAVTSAALAEALNRWLAGSRQRPSISAAAPYAVADVVRQYEEAIQCRLQ